MKNSTDARWIFEAVKGLWGLDVQLDQASEDAIHLLNLAAVETSDRAAFLTAYLALEALIPRRRRSKIANDLIKKMEARLHKAQMRKHNPIDALESHSLIGGLRSLREESFSSAFKRHVRAIQSPTHVGKWTIRQFAKQCISVRHKIAHGGSLDSHNLQELTTRLREFTMGIVWTRCGDQAFSFRIPPSNLTIPPGGLTGRAL